MDEIDDELRPSTIDVQRIYTQCSQRWSSQVRKSHLQREFPPESLRLDKILGRVPSYLGYNLVGIREQNKRPEFELYNKVLPSGLSVLYINGQSLWNVGEGDCGLDKKSMSHQLLLGVQKSVSCSFSSEGQFANWPGTYDYDKAQQASRMVPVQLDDRIVYLCHQAEWSDQASESLLDVIGINLGPVNNDAARWWTAILAKDEGWRAEIQRNETVYRSPWSTTNSSTDYKFRLQRTNSLENSCSSSYSPPNSEIALSYLIDFCYLHNVESQCSTALAAALTLPSITKANLPAPTSHDTCVRTHKTPEDISFSRNSCFSASGRINEKDEILRDFRLLPYYMTLSCSSRGLESILCNTFFNPHIPSNLVSAWIQPIFEVLDPLITEMNYKVLAMLISAQSPNIGALWTGAIITGMAQTILQRCRNGFIAIDIHSAAWTNTTQTFMSLDPQPLPSADLIYRSDECRLLYLAGEELNSRLPICAWRPFGTTALCDTEICVRTHAHCSGGHYLRYSSWSWLLKSGERVQDPGFCSDKGEHEIYTTTDDNVILDARGEIKQVRETISETLTRSIFGWLRSYGWPTAEKHIYTHSWIISEGSDDESEVDPEDDLSDPGTVKYSGEKFERIAAWLEQCKIESGLT